MTIGGGADRGLSNVHKQYPLTNNLFYGAKKFLYRDGTF